MKKFKIKYIFFNLEKKIQLIIAHKKIYMNKKKGIAFIVKTSYLFDKHANK